MKLLSNVSMIMLCSFLNKRYAKALTVKDDYNRFFEEIAKAGYATDPNYAKTLKAVSKSITKYVR